MTENNVVLPAPLGPINAVMRPACAASETSSSASSPPKLLLTRSTRSSGSAMGALHRQRSQAQIPHPELSKKSHNAVRRERHDHDQHTAIDHEVEARGVPHHQLGQFTNGLDHHGADEWTKHGSDP